MLKVLARYDIEATAYGRSTQAGEPVPEGWELVGFARTPTEAKSLFEGHVRERVRPLLAAVRRWKNDRDDEETNDRAATGCTTRRGPERGEKRR